jgi:hypothetical protein
MSDRDRREQSELERRAKEAFDESVAGIDAATRSRLTQARYRALQELERGTRPIWVRSLAPAGALAAVALAAVVLLWRAEPGADGGLQTAPLADLELLLGEEELEMLDEEIEFYAWLEEQPEFSAPAATNDGVG